MRLIALFVILFVLKKQENSVNADTLVRWFKGCVCQLCVLHPWGYNTGIR